MEDITDRFFANHRFATRTGETLEEISVHAQTGLSSHAETIEPRVFSSSNIRYEADRIHACMRTPMRPTKSTLSGLHKNLRGKTDACDQKADSCTYGTSTYRKDSKAAWCIYMPQPIIASVRLSHKLMPFLESWDVSGLMSRKPPAHITNGFPSSHMKEYRRAVMFFNIPLYLFCVRATFALQFPRQATVPYTNTSSSASSPSSTTPGPYCCELYAPGVSLDHWYDGPVPNVLDQIIVTEYVRYNSTFSQTATPEVTSRCAITHVASKYEAVFVPVRSHKMFDMRSLLTVYLYQIQSFQPQQSLLFPAIDSIVMSTLLMWTDPLPYQVFRLTSMVHPMPAPTMRPLWRP
jgi:hypothetical protein